MNRKTFGILTGIALAAMLSIPLTPASAHTVSCNSNDWVRTDQGPFECEDVAYERPTYRQTEVAGYYKRSDSKVAPTRSRRAQAAYYPADPTALEDNNFSGSVRFGWATHTIADWRNINGE